MTRAHGDSRQCVVTLGQVAMDALTKSYFDKHSQVTTMLCPYLNLSRG